MYQNSLSSVNRIGRKLFVWSFVLVVLFLFVAGRGIAASDNESGQEVFGAVEFSADGRIPVINFMKDAGIRKALGVLAATCDRNIVPTPGIDGELAFTRLRDVTFEEAMDAILGSNFKYEQKGNLIKVYTAEEYQKIKQDKDRMLHRVFTLYYISAEEVVKLIQPVLSASAILQGSTITEAGISAGKDGVAAKVGGDSMALHDTIVIHDYPENLDKAAKVIANLDVRPQQVLIEATILSATLSEGMEFGIDWNLLGGVSLDGDPATQDYVSPGGTTDIVDRGDEATRSITQIAVGDFSGTAMESFGFAKLALSGLRIGITSGDLSGFIAAQESVTDITVLANPKILALNKQVGTILIGQQLGYRDRTSIDASGQATVGEVSFLETGTKLSFRPYIGNDGYIRMDIYPQDSSGQVNVEGIPTKTTAELSTNIMVKDGETIVIGGLFRDAVTTTRTQVPLLGDLPLIGAAFRGTTDSSVRQEVIVMLTPHIIESGIEADSSERAEDIGRKSFGAKEGLQWIGRARLVEDRYAKAAQYYLEGDTESALKELKTVLELRPTYLEAIRLKERIISETEPEQAAMMERNVLADVEKEATDKWLRR